MNTGAAANARLPILLIEDERSVMDFISTALERSGVARRRRRRHRSHQSAQVRPAPVLVALAGQLGDVAVAYGGGDAQAAAFS